MENIIRNSIQTIDIFKSNKNILFKVKGDGASVVLETCPNVYSLGYLVFAAAGLKQVFGYEDRADTKFTEIFYRGPSDQKLSTIGDLFWEQALKGLKVAKIDNAL